MSKKRPTIENPMAGELAPPPERQFFSLGFICQAIQQTPDFVQRLMRTCNVEFAWTQDGIGVIRGDDVVKMKQTLCSVRDECAAAPNN